MLNLKVVKIYIKIIVSLHNSKSVTHFVTFAQQQMVELNKKLAWISQWIISGIGLKVVNFNLRSSGGIVSRIIIFWHLDSSLYQLHYNVLSSFFVIAKKEWITYNKSSILFSRLKKIFRKRYWLYRVAFFWCFFRPFKNCFYVKVQQEP